MKTKKLKIKLSELKEQVKEDFKKDDTLTGFEIKKAIENLFKRVEQLELKIGDKK